MDLLAQFNKWKFRRSLHFIWMNIFHISVRFYEFWFDQFLLTAGLCCHSLILSVYFCSI
jgi:hypothetical protein